MSFGSGGFGGFGSNNQQQSTFGGFGANNNIGSGFGSNSNSGSIFGGQPGNTGGSLFGNTSNTTSSPFGGGGGFGTNTQTSFGSKPFGSGGGNLFGGGGSTSGTTFGGFGATANTNTSTGFGGGNTSGGLFGQNKTGFGASATNTGGNLFGGGTTNTTSGFGTTSGGFGGSSGGAFGAAASNAPNNGTAATPFQAFQEKETGTNGQAQYQTITFQQPYQNYSLEELRMADYNQGRRYGNQNGQAGAFGQSTGFGGFGSNTAANNTSTGFGANANTGGGMFGNTGNTGTSFGGGTSTGFGAGNTNTSGGGLFGQNKSTGGLFGSTTAQTGTTGGNLFGGGTNTNTGGAFGSGGTGFGSSTGGGLFGQNNQTQNKTGFGGFGNTNTPNTTTTSFGGSTLGGQSNTGSGLFGQQNQTAPTGFGNNTQTTGTGVGLFGNTGGAFGQTQQNQSQNQTSGGLFGGGGFGQNTQANQQKSGGLFGGSATNTTGGGLFGNNNQQQQQQQPAGGLFGQNKSTGGLFGSAPANQPTATGGLFGNTNTNTGNTGGGLFGNMSTQNTQQNAGGGLFGASNNQQKPGSLFGGSTTANTGGGLFNNMGQSTANQSTLGGSLFGSQNQQQQNQQPAGNSLFGASGNSLLQTSMNTNPYGNDALFAGLATPAQSPGPLATPLSSSQKNRKSSIIPQHKLNPSQSTRLLTPQGKRNGGYGFTYSTYGTPTSASGQSSPLSGSLFSPGSLSRSLGKSLSTSNLRNSFTPDTSILAPGAFSTTGRSFGSGSLKKLNINRSINSRPSLFEDASPAKRVSFAGPSSENTQSNGPTVNGSSSGALVVREESRDASPGSSSTTANSEPSNGSSNRPEMQQVNGKELTPVPENGALAPRTSASLNVQNGQVLDPKAGAYYSSPSLDELKKMNKRQLENIPNFIVGRDKIGKIEFNMGKPVNLSDVPLDKLFGDIVQLNHRNATCYGETCSVAKPPLGSGLNHHSRITLGNSWPRGASRPGKKDTKHLERLKRVGGTTFEDYRPETGEWVFTVPHFSTYGFDYDDDEDESSPLSAVPDTPAQHDSGAQGSSFISPSESSPGAQSSPDDTFDFKKGMRKRANVPGQFGDQAAYEEDEEMEESRGESFLGERSVGSLDGQQDYTDESGSESADDQDMTDSVSRPIRTTERAAVKEPDLFKDSIKPKSILKASQLLQPTGTPSKGPYVFDDDWANTLQRTISPKKQDRQALRETQIEALRERDANPTVLAQSVVRNTKTTMDRMDLMDSLFGETDKRMDSTTKRAGHGMQYPYAKRPKTSHDLDQLDGADKDFHSCNKPHFSETGVLVYTSKNLNTPNQDLYHYPRDSIAGAEKDICFKKLPTFIDAVPPTVDLQKEHSKVFSSQDTQDVPYGKLRTEPDQLDFEALAKFVPLGTATGTHEQQAWKLLSLLFDGGGQSSSDMNQEEFNQHKTRVRKEQLSEFWKSLVYEDAQKHVRAAGTPEEKAIAYLSCNSVADACNALLEGFDLRLATMVAQIGGDDTTRQDMTSQIEEWRRMDVLAEIDEPVRALYELVAGNCAQSEGKTGGGRENKASTFNIASRFNLDWRRAFGLRLWYGIRADESIEMAVAQFADALAYGKEDVKPVPWFVEEGKDMGWNDLEKDNREDLLWGVLKLYASAKMELPLPVNIEDVIAPENVSGHPLNARMSFQLFQVFKSRRDDPDEDEERIVGMPTVRSKDIDAQSSFLSSTATDSGDDQAEDPLIELGDKLAITYAASLHTPEHWTTAAWVYMHVSRPAMRAHYIRSLLNQFSNTYSLTDSDPTYTYLSRTLFIPGTWMHAAAALQAKTEGDALRQAMHLIQAEEPEEAHEVLCRSVGPESIISRDYDALRELMGGFIPTPTSSPTSDHGSRFARSGKTKEPVPGWNQGGAIYFDYIELLDLTGQRSAYRVDEELNHKINELLCSLQRALEVVARDRWEACGLEERVALSEISGVVAGLVSKNKNSEKARVLKLPLTEDLWLKHSCDLSASYYRNVMAGGR